MFRFLAAAVAAFALAPFLQAADPPLAGTVDVTSTSGGLLEDRRDGAFGEPSWVKSRRFATTRVYIQRDPWEVGLEQWWRARLSDGEWKHRLQEEIELGLPGRFQVDLYENWTIEENKADHLEFAAEVRWALADWDVIPLNPTLYFEYAWRDPSRGGDVIEPKLLFGDDFGNGWHWGVNLFYEAELSGAREQEWQATAGLSYSLIDEALSVGVEMKYDRDTVAGERGNPEHLFLLGPSVQWRPRQNVHLDLVALAGLTPASPDLETWVVFGVDFGGGHDKAARAPVSGGARRIERWHSAGRGVIIPPFNASPEPPPASAHAQSASVAGRRGRAWRARRRGRSHRVE